MNSITVSNLTKRYPTFSLNNINLDIESGTVMGLIGENGAGKSTLINCILGLCHPDEGLIDILGDPGSLTLETKQHLGIVLESAMLPDYITMNDTNIMMKHLYQHWHPQQFFDYCERFELPLKQAFSKFSRGMKMKAVLAVALSHDAQILILDEATSGLDPIVRDELLDLLLDFMNTENRAILMSSHITSDLEKVSDTITYIHQGKIIFSAVKDDLIDHYRLVQLTPDQLEQIDPAQLIGLHHGEFNIAALMEIEHILPDYISRKPTLEEIMLYMNRGLKQ